MVDEHRGILDIKIVPRIRRKINAPPDAGQQMFLNHRDRHFPERKAKRSRGILAGKNGQETLRELPLITEQRNGHDQKNQPKTFVVHRGEHGHHGKERHPSAARICQKEAKHGRQSEHAEPGANGTPFRKKKKRRHHAQRDQKISGVQIRIAQGGKHAPIQKRKPFRVNPSLRRCLISHVRHIQELKNAVNQNA